MYYTAYVHYYSTVSLHFASLAWVEGQDSGKVNVEVRRMTSCVKMLYKIMFTG